jgi:peptide/nickel transport system substrate-binding protein
MMARSIGIGILAAALMLGSSLAHASTLRIALNEDPDALDPASGVSFAGRVVFASLCDKLVDIDARLNYLPQLATEWSWSADNLTLTMKLRSGVVFQDGEPFDAEAVKYNIERYQNAPFSKRKTELKQVKSVEAIDPTTVAFHLSEPSAPLIGVLSDRAGMMVSPKAGTTAGDKFGANPVCAGPYKFRSRVAQEKITVERFDRYWNRAAIGIDEVEFVPVPDSAVRLANLKSGGFDIIERVPPTDAPAIASDQRLKLVESPATLYYHISINLVGPQVAPPLAQDARVREALDAAIDRTVLNQVVFNGKYVPNNQPILPGSSYYDAAARSRQSEGPASGSRRRVPCLHPAGREQPDRPASSAGYSVHGRRGGLRHEDPGGRGQHAGRGGAEGRLPGDPGVLERAAGSRRQHQHLAAMRRLAQLGPLLQPQGRRGARQGAPGDRAQGAAQIL